MALTLEFFRPAPFPRLRVAIPLLSAQVCAGFPSPADDHLEGEIDLTELLITNPPATFLIRASGLSMTGERVPIQIHDGDLLVVNRAVVAQSGHVIVACLNGEFTIKQLKKEHGRVWLQAANDDFPAIEITEETDFQVWGVITAKVTQFKV